MGMYFDDENDMKPRLILDFVLITCVVTGLGMWGCPQYLVWQQGLSGQAALAKATQDRQIKIQEAQAMEEAAKHFKLAEITRAEGHAKAVEIVGQALKIHPNGEWDYR